MRILAIDLGDVRTGLAAGEDITGTVEPLRVLEERNQEKGICDSYQKLKLKLIVRARARC